MALMNCPECGGKVSNAAEVCPHCGLRLRMSAMQQAVAGWASDVVRADASQGVGCLAKLWGCVVAIILIFFIVVVVGSLIARPKRPPQVAPPAVAPGARPPF